jgi:hypothetical protein
MLILYERHFYELVHAIASEAESDDFDESVKPVLEEHKYYTTGDLLQQASIFWYCKGMWAILRG